jgi:rhodanese-related sulfurtransferase
MGNIKGESESMKKIALITISLLCSMVIQAQDIKGFVGRQLQTDVGYKCVNLKGGIIAWQGANMPVVKE